MRKKYLIDEAPVYRRVLILGGRLKALSLFPFYAATTLALACLPIKEKNHDPCVQHES